MILKDTDLVELLYQDKAGPLTVEIESLTHYFEGCKKLNINPLFSIFEVPAPETAVAHWAMPEYYQALDLELYFAERISTLEEAERVALELELFAERGLIPVLRFMIYLVQLLKDNKIVWGVGRGSSVSSYLLFLAGLHQINPIKYKLGIEEFIR